MIEEVLCACGCKQQFPKFDDRGRPREYLRGHFSRGKRAPWMSRRKGINVFLKKQFKPKIRATRWRARQLVKSRLCGLAMLGNCMGQIDINHIDKNPFNNALPNLIALCRSHHRLVDLGRIDLDRPIAINFYVDGSGKRRYESRNKRYDWSEKK